MFIELIHNTRYLSQVSSFGMLPEKLTCLCSWRYLTDEHISWVIQKLNSAQFDVLYIYGNFGTDIESGQHKKLLFRNYILFYRN